MKHGTSLEKGLTSVLQELKVTFRYAICNSTRFLSIAEEESIMGCLGDMLWRTVQSETEGNDFRWTFICDLFGLNELEYKSTINSKQNMGPLNKYTAKLISKLDSFVPFNLITTFYSSIRPNYKLILRFILDSLLQKEGQKEG